MKIKDTFVRVNMEPWTRPEVLVQLLLSLTQLPKEICGLIVNDYDTLEKVHYHHCNVICSFNYNTLVVTSDQKAWFSCDSDSSVVMKRNHSITKASWRGTNGYVTQDAQDGQTQDSQTPLMLCKFDTLHSKQYTIFNDIQMIMMANGVFHTLILDDQKQVWSFGSNSSWQLGRYQPSYQLETTPGLVAGGSLQKNCIFIAARYYSSVAVSANGDIWWWGAHITSPQRMGLVPQKLNSDGIPLDTQVVAISLGYQFILALGKNGSVWGLGDNCYGQIPSAYNEMDELHSFWNYSSMVGNTGYVGQKKNGFAQAKIQMLATGDKHSLFLDSEGQVWACGSNESGQLGLGSNDDKRVVKRIPMVVENLPKIIAIHAGSHVSFAIDNYGYIWHFGHSQRDDVFFIPERFSF